MRILPSLRAHRRGSALLVITIVILSLTVLGVAIVSTAKTHSDSVAEGRFRAQALSAAETGLALTLEQIASSNGTVLTSGSPGNIVDAAQNYSVPQGSITGTVVVTTEDLGTNGVDDDGDGVADNADESVLRVVATGSVSPSAAGANPTRRRIEAFMRAQYHEAFYKAVYVGNDENDAAYNLTFGPTAGAPFVPTGSESPNANWETASHASSADYIEGDVYVGGNGSIRGTTEIYGDFDATGTVTGDVVSTHPSGGTANAGVSPISPPDLQAINYDSIADHIISSTNSPTAEGLGWLETQRSGSSYYGSLLTNGALHDRPYFHLGNQSGDINITNSDAGKLIVVKGNLWVHTTSSLTVAFPSSMSGPVTLVVEGNVYIADDIEYGNNDQGLLIIAKGDGGESFTDQNNNYQYDAGEPIVNDDGDGVYEGPVEGQGNVFFGDPRFGTGGVTDGYLFAENNAYLINDGTEGSFGSDERVWGVEGFLSAGNQMFLGNRSAGGSYENFRVNYDKSKFESLDFKGIPGPLGGDFSGLTVVSWREISPN